MDWQLVARYFTVKSTDFFTVHTEGKLLFERSQANVLATSDMTKFDPISIERDFNHWQKSRDSRKDIVSLFD